MVEQPGQAYSWLPRLTDLAADSLANSDDGVLASGQVLPHDLQQRVHASAPLSARPSTRHVLPPVLAVCRLGLRASAAALSKLSLAALADDSGLCLQVWRAATLLDLADLSTGNEGATGSVVEPVVCIRLQDWHVDCGCASSGGEYALQAAPGSRLVTACGQCWLICIWDMQRRRLERCARPSGLHQAPRARLGIHVTASSLLLLCVMNDTLLHSLYALPIASLPAAQDSVPSFSVSGCRINSASKHSVCACSPDPLVPDKALVLLEDAWADADLTRCRFTKLTRLSRDPEVRAERETASLTQVGSAHCAALVCIPDRMVLIVCAADHTVVRSISFPGRHVYSVAPSLSPHHLMLHRYNPRAGHMWLRVDALRQCSLRGFEAEPERLLCQPAGAQASKLPPQWCGLAFSCGFLSFHASTCLAWPLSALAPAR